VIFGRSENNLKECCESFLTKGKTPWEFEDAFGTEFFSVIFNIKISILLLFDHDRIVAIKNILKFLTVKNLFQI